MNFFNMIFSLPRQVTVIDSHSANRALYDSTPVIDNLIVSSSSTSERLSVRSATQFISKILLAFVPLNSNSVHTDSMDDLPCPPEDVSRSPADILSTYFSFSYYLCVSPFKFRQLDSGQYQLHKFLPHQIICISISVTSLLIRLAELRESWPNQPHQTWNPVSYFRVCNAFSNLIFHVIMLMTLWVNVGRLLEIMNFYQRNKRDYFLRKSWSSKAPSLIVTFCILNFATGSACFIFGTDALPCSTWNPEILYKCIFWRAKYTLFLIKEPTCEDTNPFFLRETANMTPIDHTLTVISSLALFFRRINGMYEELFIFAGAFTFWLSSNTFSQQLKDCNDTRIEGRADIWGNVYNKYAKLTELSDVINNAYGPVYFAFTVTSLFYYSINLDNLLVSDDILVRAKFIVFYTGLVMSYLLSADICRQIGYLEIWISKHLDEKSMSELSHKQLSLILHEIATTRVGMTGCHLFTVTYSMVAQLAGILITYFMISVQYREI